jgi:hypothetical protein
MAGLTISSGDIHGLIAKLTEEIQKNGYKTPKSFKNNLTFAGTGFAKLPVTVMAADASVDVTCPADLQSALRKVFPEASEKKMGNKRRAAIILGARMVFFVFLLGLDIIVSR